MNNNNNNNKENVFNLSDREVIFIATGVHCVFLATTLCFFFPVASKENLPNVGNTLVFIVNLCIALAILFGSEIARSLFIKKMTNGRLKR